MMIKLSLLTSNKCNTLFRTLLNCVIRYTRVHPEIVVAALLPTSQTQPVAYGHHVDQLSTVIIIDDAFLRVFQASLRHHVTSALCFYRPTK